MLVLGRSENQSIEVQLPDGSIVVIVVCEIRRRWIRLGVTAPADVKIIRQELLGRTLTVEEVTP